MKKLELSQLPENNLYILKSSSEEYQFRIRFIGIDINISDIKYIYFSCELLDPNYIEYSRSYNFGPINHEYGRKLSTNTIQDVIIVETSNEKIYLQRYYG